VPFPFHSVISARHLLVAVGLLFWLALAAGDGQSANAGQQASSDTSNSLVGHVLVASPGMSDPRFAQTIIIIVEHNSAGGWGLIVNRPVGEALVDDLLVAQDVERVGSSRVVGLYEGGPVEQERGFVLHTPDYVGDATLSIGGIAAVTVDVGVLRALAGSGGPQQASVVFGYAGWDAGQLEQEIERGDWAVRLADAALIFDGDRAGKWRKAIEEAEVI